MKKKRKFSASHKSANKLFSAVDLCRQICVTSGVFYLQVVSIDDSSFTGLVNPSLSGIVLLFCGGRLVFE